MNDIFAWLPLALLGMVLRAFFAVAELAVATLDARWLEPEAQSGNRAARAWIALLDRRVQLLSAMMAGGTVALVATITATVMTLAAVFPEFPWLFSAVFVILLMTVLFLGLPQAVSQPRAHRIALRLVVPIRIAAFLLTPFVWLNSLVSRIFSDTIATSGALRAHVTRDELRSLLTDASHEEITPQEREMITRVLDFSALTVKDVMVPLIDIKAVTDDLRLEDAIAAFVRDGHSRIPVYSERIDNMVGILYAFDVLFATDFELQVRAQMRPAKYVPETTSVNHVLAELQKSRMGLAIVVDEYGGAIGLISIEDILEQIVGDIEDEFDRQGQDLRRIGPDEYLVNARLRLDKLSEVLGISFVEGDYETVGGLLLAEMRHIPRVGENLRLHHVQFTVRKASDRAIKEVHISARPN